MELFPTPSDECGNPTPGGIYVGKCIEVEGGIPMLTTPGAKSGVPALDGFIFDAWPCCSRDAPIALDECTSGPNGYGGPKTTD